jgi:hypothetical protein
MLTSCRLFSSKDERSVTRKVSLFATDNRCLSGLCLDYGLSGSI